MQHWLQELISFSNGTLDLRVCYYSGMEVKIRKDMEQSQVEGAIAIGQARYSSIGVLTSQQPCIFHTSALKTALQCLRHTLVFPNFGSIPENT